MPLSITWVCATLCEVTRDVPTSVDIFGKIRDDRWRVICDVHGKTIGRAMYTPSHNKVTTSDSVIMRRLIHRWVYMSTCVRPSNNDFRVTRSYIPRDKCPAKRWWLQNHISSDTVCLAMMTLTFFWTAVFNSIGILRDSNLAGRVVWFFLMNGKFYKPPST